MVGDWFKVIIFYYFRKMTYTYLMVIRGIYKK